MSGEGPESVPTSADPRSKRPLKKRALTPTSAQAASLDVLFARPDQPVRLPPSAAELESRAAARKAHALPEIVTNVQGSSAGAGSGEFHVYKAARRREYERLRAMDAEKRREDGKEEFERTKAERETKDEERTRRNREKREKAKARKAKGKEKGKADGQEEGPQPAANGAGKGRGVEDKWKGVANGNPLQGDQSASQDDPAEPGRTQTEQTNGADEKREKAAAVQVPGLLIHDDD